MAIYGKLLSLNSLKFWLRFAFDLLTLSRLAYFCQIFMEGGGPPPTTPHPRKTTEGGVGTLYV